MSGSSIAKELVLDENISKADFIGIISSFYTQECFIYAIIPDWEKELINELSNHFIKVREVKLPHVFPKTTGYIGFVKDREKHFIYEFYLRSAVIDIVFSNIDISDNLFKENKKSNNLFKIFESNKIPHVTIGPDGQWLNIIEY